MSPRATRQAPQPAKAKAQPQHAPSWWQGRSQIGFTKVARAELATRPQPNDRTKESE